MKKIKILLLTMMTGLILGISVNAFANNTYYAAIQWNGQVHYVAGFTYHICMNEADYYVQTHSRAILLAPGCTKMATY